MTDKTMAQVQTRFDSLKDYRVWERKTLLALVDIFLLIFSLFLYHRSISKASLHLGDFLSQEVADISYALIVFLALSIIFNLYDLEYVNRTRKVLPLAFFIGLLTSLSYVFNPLTSPSLPETWTTVALFTFGFTFALSLWRTVYASVIHSNLFIRNIIILSDRGFDPRQLKELRASIEGYEYDHGFRIMRSYEIPEGEAPQHHLARTIDRIARQKLIDYVVVVNQDQKRVSRQMNRLFVNLLRHGVQVKTYFQLYEELKEALPLNRAGNQIYGLVNLSGKEGNFGYLLWQGVLNITSALIGLVIMIILMPFILLFNLIGNRGPLFYRQVRVGQGGKEFELIKFRSMVEDAEKHGAKMSGKGDKRITSFGKVLRKTRIDELPQFWSVLKGDMNLIGPRPERRVFIDELIESIPLYDSRHIMKPGITGWAQVKYPYGENTDDSYKKLEYDMYYIKNRSVTLDIRIIYKTIYTIIFSKGQ